MGSFFGLSIFLLVITTIQQLCMGDLRRQCYVCGRGADEPFKHDAFLEQEINKNRTLAQLMDNIPSTCDDLLPNGWMNMTKFMRQCPNKYVGCISQNDGTNVIRSCATLAVNDCKKANGINYCYCNSDLCNLSVDNRNDHRSPVSRDTTFYIRDDTDDEDLLESSGLSSNEDRSSRFDSNDHRSTFGSIDHRTTFGSIDHRTTVDSIDHRSTFDSKLTIESSTSTKQWKTIATSTMTTTTTTTTISKIPIESTIGLETATTTADLKMTNQTKNGVESIQRHFNYLFILLFCLFVVF